MNTKSLLAALLVTGSVTLVVADSWPVAAATLCVNPGGKGGCFAAITAAVGSASAGDTIQVAPGTYFEDVIIGKSLSLVGANNQHDH